MTDQQELAYWLTSAYLIAGFFICMMMCWFDHAKHDGGFSVMDMIASLANAFVWPGTLALLGLLYLMTTENWLTRPRGKKTP